jgi:ABC-type sugar transport system ATPase subunit
VLSKWLLIQPELMIMDEPTKGIDIGAKHEIYKLMLDLVDKGASILLISSEIEELLGLCDRIIVMKSGHLSAQYKRSQFKRSDILEAALHQK